MQYGVHIYPGLLAMEFFTLEFSRVSRLFLRRTGGLSEDGSWSGDPRGSPPLTVGLGEGVAAAVSVVLMEDHHLVT